MRPMKCSTMVSFLAPRINRFPEASVPIGHTFYGEARCSDSLGRLCAQAGRRS